MDKTTMAVALAKAGRKGPDGRLEDHAIQAWDDALGGVAADDDAPAGAGPTQLQDMALMALNQSDRDFQAALGLFLANLSTDAGALSALIGGDKLRARAGEYLHEVWGEHFGPKNVKVKAHGRAAPSKNGGQGRIETQEVYAAGGGGHRLAETQFGGAPAALSTGRRAAAHQASAIIGKAWFEREVIRGTALGQISWNQGMRLVPKLLTSGLGDLRHAYLLVRALKSAAYHPGMDHQPLENWVDPEVIAAADERFEQFSHLVTGEVEEFIALEHMP